MNAIQRDRAYGRRLQRMKPDAIVHRGDRQPSPAERMQRYVSLRAILPIESQFPHREFSGGRASPHARATPSVAPADV